MKHTFIYIHACIKHEVPPLSATLNDSIVISHVHTCPEDVQQLEVNQHRKLTLEKKFLLPGLEPGPGPFDHESGALTTELSPLF